jgi:hypothetical protein
MAAIGFLLGRPSSSIRGRPAHFKVLEQGDCALLRRKFKAMVEDKTSHELAELFYMSSRAETKRKRFNRGSTAIHEIKLPETDEEK